MITCTTGMRRKNQFCSGVFGRPHHPVMKPPAVIIDTDYLICESACGDRLHDRSSALDQLEKVVKQTVSNGGSIVIPLLPSAAHKIFCIKFIC